MDRFATLEPVRLHGTAAGSKSRAAPTASPRIGRLPADLHLLVLAHTPVPDVSAYARACRALSALARDERVWARRLGALDAAAVDELEARAAAASGAGAKAKPPELAVDADDFGDFAEVDAGGLAAPGAGAADELGEFVGGLSPIVAVARPMPLVAAPAAPSSRTQYMRAHALLRPLAAALSAPPHAVLSALFPPNAPAPPTLSQQSATLRLLAGWLSPAVQPLRAWAALAAALRAALDRFDAGLLAAFDAADGRADEPGMRAAAAASWAVRDPAAPGDEWELGRVWADKRELFYEQGRWDAAQNVTCVRARRSRRKREAHACVQCVGRDRPGADGRVHGPRPRRAPRARRARGARIPARRGRAGRIRREDRH
jgi:recyclin-1